MSLARAFSEGRSHARYESLGKQEFRELLLALATATGVHTYGTFWGTGIDSLMFAEAGFDVIACEVTQAKHLRMTLAAASGGYRAFTGRAGNLCEHRDMFNADFDGGPSPANFRELRRISAITDKWLIVQMSMDHIRDKAMEGEAAFYTVPAWLTGASGFTLEYLSRYKRNRFGQTMWVAILRKREGKGTRNQVLPIQIAYSIGERGYWASRAMYERALLPHRYSPRNEREKAQDHSRYLARRKDGRAAICIVCARTFQRKGGPQVYCSDACRRPAQKARRNAYHRDWYLDRKLAAVSGTTAEAIKAA